MPFNRSSRWTVVIVFALLISGRSDAQSTRAAVQGQAPAIRLTGRVVADDTGIALPNVRVAPSSVARETVPPVLTDGEGRFALLIPQSSRGIRAVKSGYAPADVPIPSASQPIEVRLRPGAVVSGRVTDEAGDPVANARVGVELAPGAASGGPVAGAATTTDDRGDYRVAGLANGSFVASVMTIGDAQMVINGNVITGKGPVKTYYPGLTSVDEAQRIQLRSSEERRGVDFVLTAQQVDSFRRPFALGGDQPATGTAVIGGHIVGSDRRGVPGARVTLVPPRARPFRLTSPLESRSARDGSFEFRGLAPGTYQLFVSKAGYLPLADQGFDANPLPPPSFELASGEIRDQINVELTRIGVMTGRVVDEYGSPVMAARVQALRVRYEGGRRKLVAADVPSRLTDDRGAFRLYGLHPGQYIVSASVGDVSTEDLPGYAPTYFPGTTSASDARFVAVASGNDLVGLDIQLARTPTARVSGRFLDESGQPGGGALSLTPSWRAGAAPAESVGARLLPDGRFEFRNVAPGEYVIQASRGRSTPWTEGQFGMLRVVVNGRDIDDLELRTSTGSAVNGRITFDARNRTRPPEMSAVEITALPVDPDLSPSVGWAAARIQSDGSFEMAGLSGPRRLVVTRVPTGWTLEEIRVVGVDATDRPIALGRAEQSLAGVEVVFSDRVSELAGAVTGDDNRAVAGVHVVVFAADRDRWFWGSRFLREAVSDEQGNYRITGLPFGSYYVTTIPSALAEGPEAWQDPTFLTTLVSRASTVTISEGQRVTRQVRVSSR